MRYDFYDLSQIPLTHPDLGQIIADAIEEANKPDAHIAHCPWDTANTTDSKYRRIVWRVVFRRIRDARQKLAAELNQMIGQRIAA
jgi:hypothetical protein